QLTVRYLIADRIGQLALDLLPHQLHLGAMVEDGKCVLEEHALLCIERGDETRLRQARHEQATELLEGQLTGSERVRCGRAASLVRAAQLDADAVRARLDAPDGHPPGRPARARREGIDELTLHEMAQRTFHGFEPLTEAAELEIRGDGLAPRSAAAGCRHVVALSRAPQPLVELRERPRVDPDHEEPLHRLAPGAEAGARHVRGARGSVQPVVLLELPDEEAE